MMRKLFFCLLVLPFSVKAQQHLIVEGSGGNFYLLHKVAPKENFYSIGRMYNVSPKEIAPYNKLALDKGVNIGQEIKIPLKNNFFSAQGAVASESAVPVYHKVEPKETLSGLSARYNKVPLVSLKAWNNLKSDAVPAGSELIVGFIMVKNESSPLAKKGIPLPADVLNVPVKKEEVKKEPVAVTVPAVKETPKTEPVKETKTEVPVVMNNAGDFKGGVFKNGYNGGGKEEKGTAGVFKSTSGWEDGKYYCLHNGASAGTIVKITNNSNGKTIYAKVLDVMPDLKDNNSLLVRISNAAADVLGAGTNNFDCTINY